MRHRLPLACAIVSLSAALTYALASGLPPVASAFFLALSFLFILAFWAYTP